MLSSCCSARAFCATALLLAAPRALRAQTVAHARDLPGSDGVSSMGNALGGRLDSLSSYVVQPRHTNGQDIINFPNGVAAFNALLGGKAVVIVSALPTAPIVP